MPTKSTTPAKKAAKKVAKRVTPAKTAGKTSPNNQSARNKTMKAEDIERGKNIITMRANEMSWAAIAKEMGISQGKAMWLEMCASVKPSERMTGDDDELGTQIVAAREDGISWGIIAARCGCGEGKVRTLFEKASGKSALGQRIGKGGRYPDGEGPSGTKAAPKRQAKAKQEDLNPDKKTLSDMDLEELGRRCNGKTISLRVGTKTQNVKCKTVLATDGSEFEITDDKGASRTFLFGNVTKVSR